MKQKHGNKLKCFCFKVLAENEALKEAEEAVEKETMKEIEVAGKVEVLEVKSRMEKFQKEI